MKHHGLPIRRYAGGLLPLAFVILPGLAGPLRAQESAAVLPETIWQDLQARAAEIAARPLAVAKPVEPNRADPPPALSARLQTLERRLDEGSPAACLRALDQLALEGAEEKDLRAEYLFLRAKVLLRLEETDEALRICEQLHRLVQDDPLRQGRAVLLEARVRLAMLQFQTTYRLAGKALDMARRQGDKRLEAQALSTIGRVSRDIYMTMPERSAPYHEQALAIGKTLRDTAFVIGELVALSLNHLDQPGPDRPVQYLREAMAWLGPGGSLKSRYEIVRQTAFLGHRYGIGPSQCFGLYAQAVDMCKQLGMRSLVQNLYEQMSGIRYQEGRYDQAQAWLDSAARHSTWKRELGYFYRSFADVALARGDRDSAIAFYQKAFDEQVKGYTNRNTLQLAEWETEFRTRETERQLEEQHAYRRWLVTLIALISVLLLGSGAGWYWQYRNRLEIDRQKKLIEAQAEELHQLDTVKNRLFANISHELRTPVTLMLGPLEQLAGSRGLTPQQSDMLRMAQNNGRQLLDMIGQILDLGKLESGKMTVNESPVAVADFLRNCTASFAGHAAGLGIRLEWRHALPPGLVTVMDAGKVETVLKNLLSNALKYTGRGGVVTVTASESAERLHLEVSDTGRGIAAADLPRIFDRYFQSGREEAPVEGGAGLGLAICGEISKLLGGRLQVDSEPGRGSTFRFEWPRRLAVGEYSLPAGYAEVLSNPQSSAGPAFQPGGSGPVVLVVEDNADLRAFIRTILEPTCQVVEAGDGREALDCLPDLMRQPAWQQHGGLILTDLMMPGLDGFGLLRALRSEPRYAEIPVVVLTARAGVQDELQELRIGTDDYLLKPFRPEEVLARIRFLLDAQRARSEAEPEPGSDLPAVQWLQLLETAALAHLGEHDFNLDTLSDLLAVSSRTLQRRLKAATGLTATQYLQELRFRQARRALESGQVDSVKGLSAAMGMRDVKYFSREFKKRFGKLPSDYLS